MPKISFVCPIFNKEKYLPYVLDSIKKQKGEFEKEYIFINDGSKDASLDILKEKTSKWKNVFILNQLNKGPAIATQLGISLAKGDYIKLVGGDDVMAPYCTELLLKTIMKTKSVAAFSSYELLPNYRNIVYHKKEIRNLRVLNNPLSQTIISSFSGTTPNLYCNKSLKKSGGCEKRIFIEDFSLVLGLSKYGSFSFIDNITSFGPKDDNTRIMIGKKNQLIHDYNAALYYFLKKNSKINKSFFRIACIKSLGRAEKWYRRMKKKNKINKMNFYKLLIYLGRSDYLNLIRESCHFFYKNDDEKSIRYRVS